MNGIRLERVQSFNFVGLLLTENISCKPHIDLSSCKLAQCAGALNKLERYLPIHILGTLYFTMVQSRIMYCILTWGLDYYRIKKMQKRFGRIVSILQTWISSYRHIEILTDITYPFKISNWNDWEWIINFISWFNVCMLTYPWLHWSWIMSVKCTPGQGNLNRNLGQHRQQFIQSISNLYRCWSVASWMTQVLGFSAQSANRH